MEKNGIIKLGDAEIEISFCTDSNNNAPYDMISTMKTVNNEIWTFKSIG